MKVGFRGLKHDGDDFEGSREFEYIFELFTILQEVLTFSNRFEIFLTPDVNTADAERVMGVAFGGEWTQGRCRGTGGALVRMTTNGGNA